MIHVHVAIKGKKLTEDFCSSINESDSVKLRGISESLKDCGETLSKRTPDVLLFGLDLPIGSNSDWADWKDFCNGIHIKHPNLKILAVITYDEYTKNKEDLNLLTSGYISKDALPKVIVSAIETVTSGLFFRYDKIAAPVKKEEPDSERLKTMIREAVEYEGTTTSEKNEEPNPDWLNSLIMDLIKNINDDGNFAEMIEKLSMIIEATEKTRRMMIEILLAEQKNLLDDDSIDRYVMLLIENLLIKGYANWDIADMLNISIETVRLYRLEFIMKLSGKNSMVYAKIEDDKLISLGRKEARLLRLIAAGYTNEKIAEILNRSIETIKRQRSNLIEKFGANNNTMTMIIKSLRMGLLKLEDIENLLPEH